MSKLESSQSSLWTREPTEQFDYGEAERAAEVFEYTVDMLLSQDSRDRSVHLYREPSVNIDVAELGYLIDRADGCKILVQVERIIHQNSGYTTRKIELTIIDLYERDRKYLRYSQGLFADGMVHRFDSRCIGLPENDAPIEMAEMRELIDFCVV